MTRSEEFTTKPKTLAVPLLFELKDVEGDKKSEASSVSEDLDTEDHQYKFLHFIVGGLLGVGCFHLVRLFVLPALPHTSNVTVERAFSTFAWSFGTTVTAYGVRNAIIVMLRSLCKRQMGEEAGKMILNDKLGDQQDEDSEEDKEKRDLFWGNMELSFTLGVFIGFTLASVSVLIEMEVPMCCVSIVVGAAVLWAVFMTWIAQGL